MSQEISDVYTHIGTDEVKIGTFAFLSELSNNLVHVSSPAIIVLAKYFMTNKKLNNIIICYMKLKQYCQQLESKLVEMKHV